MNFLLTSHVWRQDHNGFTHQDPGFLDVVVNKKASVVRIYLPPDANCLLSVADHCLRTRDYVNVIVAGKQPQPTWLSMDDAVLHCTRGIGIWEWASTDGTREPDVVMACAGDVPTLETLAAVSLLREHLPDLAVRVVNVVDLMRLVPETEHPHGLDDHEFDTIFTADKPIIFAFHGYPYLIHRLTYRRHGHDNMHVRGYIEEGTTTTPFDMVVMNDLDRFHLVMDVIDRVPGLGTRAAGAAAADDRRPHPSSPLHARVRRGPPRGPQLDLARLTGCDQGFGDIRRPFRSPIVAKTGEGGAMRILVVNAGSSSLKLSVLDGDDVVAHPTPTTWRRSSRRSTRSTRSGIESCTAGPSSPTQWSSTTT